MKSDKMNGLLSHALIFKISPINAFVIWEVLNLGFNIGRGEQTSINHLARLVLEVTGLDLEPIHEKPRTGDVRHSLADISRAKSYGYNPKYSVKEGLKETVRWFGHEV